MENVEIASEVVKLATMIVGLVLAGQAGLLVALGYLFRGILKSPALLAYVESLANSIPAETRELINTAGTLITEATDNVPASTKTTLTAESKGG